MFDRSRLPDPVQYFESERLVLLGKGKWRSTRCVFHGGSDSMRINTDSGGFCCMNCGARGGDVVAYAMQAQGLGFIEAARSLGAWIDDGKPDRVPRERVSKLSMRERLEVLYPESLLLLIVGSDMRHKRAISDADFERLGVAIQRIGHVTWRLDE